MMVDRLPEIDEIDSIERLEQYLKAQPEALSRFIAARNGFRAFPAFVRSFGESFLSDRQKKGLFITVLRGILVCWLAYERRELHLSDQAKAVKSDLKKFEKILVNNSNAYGAISRSLDAVETPNLSPFFALRSIVSLNRDPVYSDIGVLLKKVLDDFLNFSGRPIPEFSKSSIKRFDGSDHREFLRTVLGEKNVIPGQFLELIGIWYTGVDFGFPRTQSDVVNTLSRVLSSLILGEVNFWHRDPDVVLKDISEQLLVAQEGEHFFDGMKPLSENVDFFISYSTKNEVDARKINGYLEDAGYTTIVQFKDFKVGSNFVAEMQKGLDAAERVIALLSPEYVASKQCQAEWNAAYNTDPLSERRHLIPLLLKKADLLPLSKQIVYKSLVGLEGEALRTAILEAVGKIRRTEVSGVTSPYDFELTATDTISVVGGSMNVTSILPNRDPKDANNRLKAARDLAGDLMVGLRSNSYQVSQHYLPEVENYFNRLPLALGESIYSADAAIRNLRDDLEDDLNQGIDERFAKRCLRLIEAHYGLRVYFPELLDFYEDVRNARQTEPLPLEALSKLRATVEQLTPEVFEPSVGEAFGHAVDVAHPLHDHASGHDTSYEGGESAGAPVSLPPDPIADIDPVRAAQHAEISMQNRIWGLLRRVEDGGKAVERIDKAVTAYSKFIDPILDWLSKSN